MTDTLYFVAGAVISVVVSPLPIWLWNRVNRKISWRRFYSALTDAKTLAGISPNGRPPDIIIGVNSGIVPASILAVNLFVKDLLFVQTMPEYDASGNRNTPAPLAGVTTLADKYVLIVDDQYYSGDTMKTVNMMVRQLPGADLAIIKRFALFAYDSPATKIHLDVRPPGRVRGILATVPWVFSVRLKKHYEARNAT